MYITNHPVSLVGRAPLRLAGSVIIWWHGIGCDLRSYVRCLSSNDRVKGQLFACVMPWDLSLQKCFSIQIWHQSTHTDNVWKEYRTCWPQLQLYMVCLTVREGLLQVRSNCDYQAKIGKRWWAVCMRHNRIIYRRKNKTRFTQDTS